MIEEQLRNKIGRKIIRIRTPGGFGSNDYADLECGHSRPINNKDPGIVHIGDTVRCYLCEDKKYFRKGKI